MSLLDGPFVPTKVIRVHSKDRPWFDGQRMLSFDLKQEAHLRWTSNRSRVNEEEFSSCQVRAIMKPTRRPSVSLVAETGMFL